MVLRKGWNAKQQTYVVYARNKAHCRDFVKRQGYPEHKNKKLTITPYKKSGFHPQGWKKYKIKVGKK